MALSVRETIGYGKEQEVTLEPLSFKEFKSKIKQLNELPLEVIQKLVSPRIVDFEAKNITKSKYDCDENKKNCEIIEARFNIMYAYDIIGFPYSVGQRFKVNGRNWNDYSNGVYPQSQFFGRKAGFMVSEVVYKHHLKGHKSTYTPFTYANHRSPFGYHTLHSDGTDKYGMNSSRMTKGVVDALFSFKGDYEPTMKNHRKFMKDFKDFISHVDHEGIKLCRKMANGSHDKDTSRMTCSSPHNEKQVCSKYCKRVDILRQFETHPHLFFSSSSFCFGNNVETNLSFQDAQKNRNPITFIKALIHSCSYITENDSRGGFEFFSDVFLNSKYIWDNKYMRVLDKLKQYIHSFSSEVNLDSEIVEGVIPLDNDHQISFECYCLACLSIRGSILFGLKIDMDKLVQDTQPYCNADQMQKLIKEFEFGKLKDYDHRMIELFNGNSSEMIQEKKFTKISEVLGFLVDLDMKELDFNVKLSPIDFRNRIISSGSSNHSLFIDYKSGMLITPSTLTNDIQRVNNFESYLNSMRNDFSDLLPLVIDSEEKDKFIELIKSVKVNKDLSMSMYEPYQLGLTKKETEKVNKIIKDYPDKSSNDHRF